MIGITPGLCIGHRLVQGNGARTVAGEIADVRGLGRKVLQHDVVPLLTGGDARGDNGRIVLQVPEPALAIDRRIAVARGRMPGGDGNVFQHDRARSANCQHRLRS